ncbi:MAG: FMN-binding protein [Caldiserica bacterium]|nr:FMN-binding protein [Caldisericota bacterium]
MKRWQMIKLGLILAMYTIVGCVGLAVVYNSTSKIIAQRQEADLQAGLHEVFPKATGFTPTDKVKSANPKVIFDAVYTANGPSGALGIAVKVQGASYGGLTTLIVGVSTDGTITGVKVLENKDTPGLGANAANPTYYVDKATRTTFAGQFAGKKLTDPFVVKKDVIAVTSATITSRSITNLVQIVGKAASDALGIGGSSQGPQAVLPSADTVRTSSKPATSSVPGVSILETLVGTKAGAIVGASAKAKATSYDGDVTVLVGVSTDGTILGVQILECTDSLGSSILVPEFAQQFVGKKVDAALKIGSGITAVTGATRSSNGATQLVKATADALVKALAGGGL